MDHSKATLKRFLQSCGVGARRKVDEMIHQGRVCVNGRVVTQFAFEVDASRDTITLDGRICSRQIEPQYYLFHKPRGIISSVSDPQGRETVIDYVRRHHGIKGYLFPVGRLDQDTEGLLILTNDGDFANQMLHPRYEAQKVYQAWVQGTPTNEEMERFRGGLILGRGKTAPAGLTLLKSDKNRSLWEIRLHEGKKRQIRLMCQALGHPVLYLKRIQMGSFTLKGIETPGQLRSFTNSEREEIQHREKERRKERRWGC